MEDSFPPQGHTEWTYKELRNGHTQCDGMDLHGVLTTTLTKGSDRSSQIGKDQFLLVTRAHRRPKDLHGGCDGGGWYIVSTKHDNTRPVPSGSFRPHGMALARCEQ